MENIYVDISISNAQPDVGGHPARPNYHQEINIAPLAPAQRDAGVVESSIQAEEQLAIRLIYVEKAIEE